MNTDYEFPIWFWDSETTDEDRHIWMTQERCRRQAMRQTTGYSQTIEQQAERKARRQKADPARVNVEKYR